MSTQPEALRLANALEKGKFLLSRDRNETAAELRRLHELALEQQAKIYALEMARSMEQKTAKLKQYALLEALKKMRIKYGEYACSVCDQADAAIKAAEEGK